MKPASIKDIAIKSGVSITTVSFILNGKAEQKRISKKVIDKVKRIIEEMDFVPNQVARSLRTGNTKTIGLIVEDISNPFFSSIARKIEDKAYKRGYKISYSSTENDPVKAKELIEMFKSRQVDAYIIAPVPGIENDIRQLISDKVPVVIFDRNLSDIEVNSVVVDNFLGTYQATKYLIDKGKRNIAFITVDVHVDQMNNRFYGYKKALEDHVIPFNSNLYSEISFDSVSDNIQAQLLLLFEKYPEIDAVFFSTNYLAIQGLSVLRQIGKSIGEDFAIISYDDHDVFRLHTPPISVVEQPIEQIADEIIDIVLESLSLPSDIASREFKKIILQPHFIER